MRTSPRSPRCTWVTPCSKGSSSAPWGARATAKAARTCTSRSASVRTSTATDCRCRSCATRSAPRSARACALASEVGEQEQQEERDRVQRPVRERVRPKAVPLLIEVREPKAEREHWKPRRDLVGEREQRARDGSGVDEAHPLAQ